MTNRLANGLNIPGKDVVAADVIAALAGVNLGNVVKVMLAVNALVKGGNVTYTEALEVDAIPLEPADDVRFRATESYVDQLVHRLQKNDHRALASELKINKRFARTLKLRAVG